MSSLRRKKQQGATLLVGMIMMVVLTLLVVFSLRSGNTNLRIAGNMQAQTEASAATQQVVEKVIETLKYTELDVKDITFATETIAIGNGTYTVTVDPMATKCIFSNSVNSDELRPPPTVTVTNPNPSDPDKACRTSILMPDPPRFKPNGEPEPGRTECRSEQWDIVARGEEQVSAATVNIVQGIAIRVPSEFKCPL